MRSSFTIQFRNPIWFVVLTSILCLIPLETRPIYGPSFSLPEAVAQEEGQPPEGATASLSFEVDEFTRTSRMSYPIAVPPGRKGIAPSIALVYQSKPSADPPRRLSVTAAATLWPSRMAGTPS